MMSKIADALVMAGAGNVPAKTPKAKAGKIVVQKIADMSLEQYDVHAQKLLDGALSAVAQEALETIAVFAEDIRYTIESKRAAMIEATAIIFPDRKGLNWDRYSACTGFLRSRSQYAYREFRRAVVALCERNGKTWHVPTAGKGTGKGRKGPAYSPKVWYRGMASTMDTLAERFAKCPKDDVDADTLRAFTQAYDALVAAQRKLAKRIAA